MSLPDLTNLTNLFSTYSYTIYIISFALAQENKKRFVRFVLVYTRLPFTVSFFAQGASGFQDKPL